ncbi:DNA-directed RNA polymerase subunit alpha [[Mycoplasma] gypis]|uniref:DNA-directed RNA polymerase subunit alpha n=2 Tax=[Mycoplasma] gypis TaxID=92404 RepID=A0ABZ2RSK7_9BACT
MAKINYCELTSERINDFVTTFTAEPLSRGFAITLGTALRRTLLSSITSCAPFAVKINKVEHEFQVIEGVEEDVVTILQNLTNIRFTYNEELFKDDSIVKISFSTKKQGAIYAGDITYPSGLKIVNPDQEIAHLSNGFDFEFEMYLRGGRGFVDFEENKTVIQNYGPRLESKIKDGQFLAVDSDFSPVKKVQIKTEELNSESLLVQEKLFLRIETDGTKEAKQALYEASQILIGHLQIIGNIDKLQEINIFKEEKIEKVVDEKTLVPIEKLDLTIRSLNALHRAGYKTVEDLLKLTEEELSNIKNLGKKSVEDILKKIGSWKEIYEKGDE